MNSNGLKKLNKTSSGLGFYIFTAIIVLNFLAIVGVIFSTFFTSGFDKTSELLLDTVVSLMSFFVVGLFYCLISNTHLSEILPVNHVKPGLTVKLVFIAVAVAFTGNFMTELILNGLSLFGIGSNYDMDYTASTPIEGVLFFIAVGVVPALGEEFAFRGIILQKLRKYGDGFAILISAVLFGLMHGNLVQIPFTFVTGLALGFITVKSNSIIPAVITHFCINSSSVLVSILEENSIFDSNVVDIVYLSFIALVIIGAVISVISLCKDKDFFTVEKNDDFSLKDKIKSTFSSVGIIMTIIVIALEIILSVSIL